jgi:transcriptional regulator with XRE-family HTH domain
MHKEELEALYAEFGHRVRTKREEAGLRQSDVAVRMNLSRGSIANVEAGRQRPTLHQVYQLARVLSVPISDLLPSDEIDHDAARHDQLRDRLMRAVASG